MLRHFLHEGFRFCFSLKHLKERRVVETCAASAFFRTSINRLGTHSEETQLKLRHLILSINLHRSQTHQGKEENIRIQDSMRATDRRLPKFCQDMAEFTQLTGTEIEAVKSFFGSRRSQPLSQGSGRSKTFVVPIFM